MKRTQPLLRQIHRTGIHRTGGFDRTGRFAICRETNNRIANPVER